MEMNTDREWLRKKAEQEDGCSVSVGGAVLPTDAAPSTGVTVTPTPSVTPTDIEAAYTLKGFNKNPPNIGSGKNLQSISQMGQMGQIGLPSKEAANLSSFQPLGAGNITPVERQALSLDEAAMRNSYLGMDQGGEEPTDSPVNPPPPIPQVSPKIYKYTIWIQVGIIYFLFILSIYNRYLYETTNFKLTEANERLFALTNCRVLSSANIPSGGYYLFCEKEERKSPNAKQ